MSVLLNLNTVVPWFTSALAYEFLGIRGGYSVNFCTSSWAGNWAVSKIVCKSSDREYMCCDFL